MTETLPELHYTEVTINSYPESYKEAMINSPPAVQSWADISLLINPCAPNDCFKIYAEILHIFHPLQWACSLIWHSYICDDALLPACPPSEQGGLLGYLQTRRIMFRSPCVPPLGSHSLGPAQKQAQAEQRECWWFGLCQDPQGSPKGRWEWMVGRKLWEGKKG